MGVVKPAYAIMRDKESFEDGVSEGLFEVTRILKRKMSTKIHLFFFFEKPDIVMVRC